MSGTNGDAEAKLALLDKQIESHKKELERIDGLITLNEAERH